jgi:hypothetical protein
MGCSVNICAEGDGDITGKQGITQQVPPSFTHRLEVTLILIIEMSEILRPNNSTFFKITCFYGLKLTYLIK